MSLSVGILGIGNCGGQIAALGKSTKNIPGMVINSSERDIDAVKSIGSIDAFILGDGRGAGLNRTIGKNYVKRNFKSLLENEAYKKFIDDIDYIFVVNSTGGGTGSSFGPILTDVLNKYYRSKGVEKNFINVGILPAINNSIGHQRNTLEYLKEMVDLGLSYMLFDNNTLGDATNDIIFDPAPHKPFSRRIFIHKIKNITKNIENQKIKNEIIEIARRLPRSSDEVCAFVVKNTRKRPEIIALNLIHPSVGTFEHLLPKCMKGMNNYLNFALECSYCNNSRHHYPIAEQIEENPYMPQNAQIQADKLISLYKKGLCKKEYIQNLQNTLQCLSDNIICIDINKLLT